MSSDAFRCPVCGRMFSAPDSKALPFCSPRCQQIDLGRWLGEDYALPMRPRDPEDDDAAFLDDSDADDSDA